MTNQSQHTPEPWHVGASPGPIIYDTRYGSQVVRMDQPFGQTDEENKANAERIVACVNACAGIANPAAIPEFIELASKLIAGRLEHSEMKRIVHLLAKLEGNQ